MATPGGRTFAERTGAAALARTGADREVERFGWDELGDARVLPFQFAYRSGSRRAGVFEIVERRAVTEPFRLRLACERRAGGALAIRLLFDRACCAGQDAAALLAAYRRLLAVAVASPGGAVDDVALAEPQDWGACRARLAAGAAAGDVSVVARFLAHARATPAARAVADGTAVLDYRELDARSERLARRLVAAGVRPGHGRVALLLPRSAAIAVGALAVLRAGAAFVPLDVGQPIERLRAILNAARVDALVAVEPTPLAGEAPRCLMLEGAVSAGAPPLPVPDPDSPAYVVFTSGSTGRPKGAVISGRNVAAYAELLGSVLGLTARDRYAHTAPFAFSSSARQLLLPLAHGAAVEVAERQDLHDPRRLLARLAGATVLDLVPSYWRRVVRAAEEAGGLPESLRLALSASEPLPAPLARRILGVLPAGARFANMYGQTETTGIVAVYSVDGPAAELPDPLPLGRPVPGTELWVLDGAGRALPRCAIGELAVAGSGVGAGYLDDPEATARAFVRVGAGAAALMLYRTGDRAFEASDGSLRIVGRADDQVKIRGHRVEPAEAERRLAADPRIEHAAVVAAPSAGGELELAAHLVVRDGARVTAAELLAALERTLPSYLVPTRFTFHDALPLNASGKLDRRALRERPAAADPAGPETDGSTAGRVARLFARVLGCSAVRGDDDFFALGGHSLLAVDLMLAVEQELGVSLTWHALLDDATARGVAKLVDEYAAVPAER